MDQVETNESATAQSTTPQEPSHRVTAVSPAEKVFVPQGGAAKCPGCGTKVDDWSTGEGSVGLSYVYALGRIEARFPFLSVEKEFAQSTGRAETAGKTDQQAFRDVLSKRENRYLARQLCWVTTIQGLETYILLPRDTSDIELLVEGVERGRGGTGTDGVERGRGWNGDAASLTKGRGSGMLRNHAEDSPQSPRRPGLPRP